MKTSIFLICLMAVCLPAAAASTTPDPFYLEVGVVNDLPTQGTQGYNYGAGGQVALGYLFDPDMSIQLNVSDLYFPNETTGLTDNEIRIYPELKFYFLAINDIRPYVTAGTGLDFRMLPGTSATNWTTEAGLGFDWSIKSDLGLFVEARWNWLTTNNLDTPSVVQDIPLLWGFRFGL
ncbi:MAG TPA: outer membrane beta-barrel protein [bacterium]|jgi:hypothetical protein|nr:outer membrane beta-barrel protein [bacterium]